jgi:sorting nexin-16
MMSSVRALKRKNFLKQKINKEESLALRRTRSCTSLDIKTQSSKCLRRTKSEPDLKKIDSTKKPLKFEAAKSERNLNILYTQTYEGSSLPSTPFRNNHQMDLSCYSMINDSDNIKVPIVGYEIVAERSRFTIFKMKIIIENYERNNFWLVLRRFTDFTRLQAKLKALFPHINLVLPKKKWFGNNFSSGFLDTRVSGLQTFINTILMDSEMRKCSAVREFFCLDEPPMFSEEVSEDCRMVIESQMETIAHLKMQLRAKDETISNLTHSLQVQKQHNDYLTSLLIK